jgi:predicted Rossmann fold flavoprotein
LESRFLDATRTHPTRTLLGLLSDWLPQRMASAILLAAHIESGIRLAHLSREIRQSLISAMTDSPLPVIRTRGYNYAEVTAGGIPLTEIHPATMESKIVPGLYLVGEILDVDGRIGGFNFQWAWSSGHVAGRAIAQAQGPPHAA